MPTAKLNDIDIYYEEAGGGFPVVMTHGLGDCAELWAGLAQALSDRYRVVSWDMRGHFRSEAPDDLALYTQDIVVEDLRALCDHLGIERAVFGGHSLGGYTALRFYEKYPQRVAALVLHAAGPGYRNAEGSQGWTDTLAKLAARQESDFSRDEKRSAKQLRVGAPALGELAQHYVRGVANVERGVMAHPAFVDATALRVPTLVMVGERDKNYLASADYFAAKLPDGRKVVVPDAGHPAMLERPEVVQSAVREFLDGLNLAWLPHPLPLSLGEGEGCEKTAVDLWRSRSSWYRRRSRGCRRLSAVEHHTLLGRSHGALSRAGRSCAGGADELESQP